MSSKKFKLSDKDLDIINKLEELNLEYLIKPVVRLIFLDKTDKIRVHKQTWKQIMIDIYGGDKYIIERTLLSYLAHYGIYIKNPNRVDLRDSKDRVKKHREKLKHQGYKNLSFAVDSDLYEHIKMAKEFFGVRSYADLVKVLISRSDIPDDFVEDYYIRKDYRDKYITKGRVYKYDMEGKK